MIDDVLQVGDEVVITIPQENRDWGYNPCPDGSKAIVLGFSEIAYGRINNFGYKPGFYVNRAWTRVRLEDGHEYSELSMRLELIDQAKYERRLDVWRKRRESGELKRAEFLHDLPDTPFWEGDRVRILRTKLTPPDESPWEAVITSIDYRDLGSTTLVGTPYPAYKISDKLGAGWHTSASGADMDLVERGNVWKFFHDEPLEFADLSEEATFFQLLGLIDDVRNPATGTYAWTKDEALETIKNGIGDAILVSSLRFSFDDPPNISVVKYRDEKLGRRVAAMTLEGFGVTS